MGKIRLELSPNEGKTEEVEIPSWWEELDTDEKQTWVQEQIVAFRNRNVRIAVTVNE